MKTYTLYDRNGKPLRTGGCPGYALDKILEVDAGEQVLEGIHSSEYYLSPATGALEPRQPIPGGFDTLAITLGETATLSGLPVPCTVIVDGVKVPVDDGVLAVTPSTIGTYRVIVDEAEYLWTMWEVTVSD